MSHTPGPWRIDYAWIDAVKAEHPQYAAVRLGNTSQFISGHCGLDNARLIAAAPDLLDALKNLLQYIDEHDWGTIPEGVTADNARAAIDKAEGRL